jgi:hypothetical protein
MKIIITLLLFFISCSSNDLYKNNSFIYSVTRNNSTYIDTLKFKVVSNFISDKLETTFMFTKDSTISKSFSRESGYTSCNTKISIKPPIGGYLDSTELIPYPELNLPPRVGDSIYSEHKIPNGISLKSDLIKGYQKVVGKTHYKNKFIDEDVWVIESYNLIKPNYLAKYYFSSNYGFVYFNYKFEDIDIKIELINYENHLNK